MPTMHNTKINIPFAMSLFITLMEEVSWYMSRTFEGIVQHFGMQAYVLSCGEQHEKIHTILELVHTKQSNFLKSLVVAWQLLKSGAKALLNQLDFFAFLCLHRINKQDITSSLSTLAGRQVFFNIYRAAGQLLPLSSVYMLS